MKIILYFECEVVAGKLKIGESQAYQESLPIHARSIRRYVMYVLLPHNHP